MGVDVATLAVKVTQEGVDSATSALGNLKQSGQNVETIIAKMESDISAANGMYKVFGSSVDATAQKQEALKTAIEGLCRDGYDKNIDKIQQLKAYYSALGEQQSQTGSGFQSIAMQIAGFTSVAGLAVQVGQKVVSGLVDMGKESITLAADYEKQRMTWGVLVGDMSAGTAVFNKLKDFANTTPLSFQAVNQAATTLKGFGVQTNELVPTLSKLGDVAMGDSNKLQSLALVYGQVAAQGKAKTQDLYQFINAGVPIFNMLAESMNKPLGSIKDLAAQGEITFDQIEKAINKATSAGGQFNGMMDKTAQSASGQWSTAVDVFKSHLADMGSTVLPGITWGLKQINEAMQEIDDRMSAKKDVSIVERYLSSNGKNYKASDFIELHDALQQLISYDEKDLSAGKFSASTQTQLRKRDVSYYRLMDQIGTQYGAAMRNVDGGLPGDSSGAGSSGDQASKVIDEVNKEYEAKIAELQRNAEVTGTAVDIEKEMNVALDASNELISKGNGLITTRNAAYQRFIQLYYDFSVENSKSGFTGNVPDMPSDIRGGVNQQSAAQTEGPSANVVDYSQRIAGIASSDTLAAYNRQVSAVETYTDVMKQLNNQIDAVGMSQDDLTIAMMRSKGATEEEIAEFKKLSAELKIKQIMEDFKKGVESLGGSTYLSSFQALGKALAAGANSTSEFEEGMKQVGASAASQMGQLLMTAGLERLVATGGTDPIGWAMFLAGGGMALISGYMSYSDDSSDSSTDAEELAAKYAEYYLNAESQNKSDAASSALGHYANGTDSAAAGWAVVGEVGPELMRVPGGSTILPNSVFRSIRGYADGLNVPTLSSSALGAQPVTAQGGSATVNITAPAGTQVSSDKTTTGANGLQIRDVVLEIVNDGITKGALTAAATSRWGVNDRGRRVS